MTVAMNATILYQRRSNFLEPLNGYDKASCWHYRVNEEAFDFENLLQNRYMNIAVLDSVQSKWIVWRR